MKISKKDIISLRHKALIVALMATTCMVASGSAEAQLKAANTATTVTAAPNGVPVVNIANPNGAGLSNNLFTDYNVDTKGVVLNNGDSSQLQRASQLAGAVSSNPNLKSEATVILNQVVSTNRSVLAGYTELVGGTADVVVANPNGITCNGCGFMNIPNVTLTTGTPVIANSGAGALTGFTVNQGDILITGTGLLANINPNTIPPPTYTPPNYIALFARSLAIQGQVYAKYLDIVAGANSIDYTSKAVTPLTPTGTAPTVAIDSSALGGMYTDRIRLIATEAGVGVHMLGDAAAGVGDFTLTSSGKVDLENHISAQGNLQVTSTAGVADSIKLTDATLASQGNTTLVATGGNLLLIGSFLDSQSNLTLQSASLTDESDASGITNNNERYAAGALTLNQTGAATLDGTSFGAGGALGITTPSLSFGADGETLYGNALQITTTNDLALTTGVSLKTQGDLSLTSTAYQISTVSGAAVESTGGNITLDSGNFSNSGTITADGGDLTVAANGTLNNNATGVLHAGVDMFLSALSTLTNDHNVIADNNLNIASFGAGNMTLANDATGTLQAGGAFFINSHSGTANVDVTNNAGKLLGNNVNWNARNISFNDNTGVQSTNDLTINANSLTFNGVNAFVSAGHNGTLTLANNLTDNAIIYGTNAMSVTAPNITIASTGGLASGGTLTATSAGIVDNSGALFAGSQLTVNSANFTNEVGGAVNSFGSANFTQINGFTNYSNFNVTNDLTISAFNFTNEIVGGDTRTWDYLLNATCVATPADCFVPDEGGGRTSSNLAFGIPDGEQDGRAGAQSDGHNTTAGGILVDNWHLVDLSGTVIGGAYSDNTEHIAGVPTDETQLYLATFYVQQQYTGYTPTAANRPNLIAGGNLTIKDFQTGKNLGGLISGNNVTITSNRGGATFDNDDLSLQQQNWEAWWDEYSPCADRTVDSCSTWNQRSYDKWINSTQTISASIGAGIFANNNLTLGGFALTNAGSPHAAAPTVKNGPGTVSGASFGGITITLPTNTNGLFIINPNPGSGPLIETNPQYQVGSAFLGPDYMVQTYGVDPDSVERQLGDANYDAQLIQQQVVNAGAGSILTGATSQAAAMQQLMDNGVTVGKSLGLTIGVAPTAAQIANLSSNMVWLVDTVVDGQHVLAPVVYLSATTKTQIASGAAISGTNVNMQLTSLTNTGGTISGTNTLNVTTQGDITNTSGTITGGNVSLASTGGSITNTTIADFTNGVNGAKTGTISSTGDLSLNAANNITNTGANINAGGNASLNAGNNITFNTIQAVQNSGSSSYSNGTPGLFNPSNSVSITTTVTNVGSGLTVGGNLASNSGHDTTFVGSNANVGGNANLNTGGSLNILAANNSTSTTTSSSSGNALSGTTTTTSDTETTNVASNFNVGGNLNSNSKGDTTIQGSNVNVTGNGAMAAGGNLNILDGQNTSDTSSTTTHLGLGTGGGVYGTQTTADTDQKGTSVASNLHFGGNGSLTAGNDITLQGSNAGATGNLAVNAGNNVNVLAGRNTDNSTHSVSTTTFGKIDGGSSDSSSGSSSGATSGTDNSNGATASADANAERKREQQRHRWRDAG